MIIALKPCVNSTANGNKCASAEIIDQTFTNNSNFLIKFNFVNPVINPNQPNHIQYFLEGRNFALFSKNLGVEMHL